MIVYARRRTLCCRVCSVVGVVGDRVGRQHAASVGIDAQILPVDPRESGRQICAEHDKQNTRFYYYCNKKKKKPLLDLGTYNGW